MSRVECLVDKGKPQDNKGAVWKEEISILIKVYQRSLGYLWMAANRSSVVLGLVGVIKPSLPSSLAKSPASEGAAAVLGSSSPARKKRDGQTQDVRTGTQVLGGAPRCAASLPFLTWEPGGSAVWVFTERGRHNTQLTESGLSLCCNRLWTQSCS